MPPSRSGIAAYSAELVPLLRQTFETLDVFVDRQTGAGAIARGDGDVVERECYSAHDFVWRHRRDRYDLTVYHLGNASCHDYMWAYLFRYPGLVVLHDAQLHQARALWLTKRWRPRRDDYLAEFRANHPEAPPDVGELVATGLGGSLYQHWPLIRLVLETARLTIVHNRRVLADLQQTYPNVALDAIEMGVADLTARIPTSVPAQRPPSPLAASRPPQRPPAPVGPSVPAQRPPSPLGTSVPVCGDGGHLTGTEVTRGDGGRLTGTEVARGDGGRLAGTEVATGDGGRLAGTEVIVAAFGGMTPEKRIGPLLRAVSAIADRHPHLHLMLVGAEAEHYDVHEDARRWGIADRVHVTGYVPDADLPAYLAAADICACLRWPTNRETSASWLRCLAAGRATVITDLTHLADVPTLDPRGWVAPGRVPIGDPIAVSIDILDEDHSLQLALDRLAGDAALRTRLGTAARAWWEAHHRLESMARAYERIISRAATLPPPRRALPRHLTADGTAGVDTLAEAFGVESKVADFFD